MDVPTLETDRLLLRPFALGDALDVRRLAGEHDVAKTAASLPHPYPNGVAEAWIDRGPQREQAPSTLE